MATSITRRDKAYKHHGEHTSRRLVSMISWRQIKCRTERCLPTAPWKHRVPTTGMARFRQGEPLWHCRFWKNIFVYRIDQPANDFNSLVDLLDTDPNRYVLCEPDVFPCAIGKSFYGCVLPPDYVHLAWSSYAAVWLSRIPMPIPGHFVALRSTGHVRAEFELQGNRVPSSFRSRQRGVGGDGG